MQYSREIFPRSERLRSAGEFSSVYSGRRVSGSIFIIYYNYTGNGRKAGFTVSKKVSKSSVKRNKIKRRMREVYRHNRGILPEDISIIIRALPQSVGADFNDIEREINLLFKTIASKKFGSNDDKML